MRLTAVVDARAPGLKMRWAKDARSIPGGCPLGSRGGPLSSRVQTVQLKDARMVRQDVVGSGLTCFSL